MRVHLPATLLVSFLHELQSTRLGLCFQYAEPNVEDTTRLLVNCRAPSSDGSWELENEDPRHRECLDMACTVPRHHVQVLWLGTPLSEYTLSFSARVTSPLNVSGVIGFLSLGGLPVITSSNSTGHFLDTPNNFHDGEFHDVVVKADTQECTVLIDGVQMAVLPGTQTEPGTATRGCGPLGVTPNSAIFGAFVTSNGRALFSRVSGHVRDVLISSDLKAKALFEEQLPTSQCLARDDRFWLPLMLGAIGALLSWKAL